MHTPAASPSEPLTVSPQSADAAIVHAEAELKRARAAAYNVYASAESTTRHAAVERLLVAREILVAITAAARTRVA